MNLLELVCLAIVGGWLVGRLAIEPDHASRRSLLQQMLVIGAGAWLAEDVAIRVYAFYFYAEDRWTLFVDRVPLLVLIIWPVVVISGFDLLRALAVPAGRWPLWLFALVVADAWFIEPIAVDAGLWTWTSPGPFAVPTIGVLGWGFYAAGIGVVMARRLPFVAVLVVGPLVCHALLLVGWWGALRWLPTPYDGVVAPVAWMVAMFVVIHVSLRRPEGLRRLVFFRAPAAVFFFGLLAMYGRDADDHALLAWSLAFAPPWLALLVFSTSAPRTTSTPPPPTTTTSTP